MFQSGFINILGRPNVGKSTLMNVLVGERMSIITNKPQTTRHRIIGILSDEHFQIVFSDTPGVIRKPAYKMQETMNKLLLSTFDDADIVLFLVEPHDNYEDEDAIIRRLKYPTDIPVFLVINKIDTISEDALQNLIKTWQEKIKFTEVVPISALNKINTDNLLQLLLKYLPEGPEYYPKDQLTDRSERFFVSEIIREKILLLYEQEIPYSCEVAIESYKETITKEGAPFAKISATIYVARKTQKPILIGHNGAAIKKLGIEARKSIEAWLQHGIFLELHVKIRENWRDDEQTLRYFGYS